MSINNAARFLTDHKKLAPEGPTTRCLKCNWWASAIVFEAQGLSSKQPMKLGIKQSNHALLCSHTRPTCSPLQTANGMHELTFCRELRSDCIQWGSSCQTASVFTHSQDVLNHNKLWPIFFTERWDCELIYSL